MSVVPDSRRATGLGRAHQTGDVGLRQAPGLARGDQLVDQRRPVGPQRPEAWEDRHAAGPAVGRGGWFRRRSVSGCARRLGHIGNDIGFRRWTSTAAATSQAGAPATSPTRTHRANQARCAMVGPCLPNPCRPSVCSPAACRPGSPSSTASSTDHRRRRAGPSSRCLPTSPRSVSMPHRDRWVTASPPTAAKRWGTSRARARSRQRGPTRRRGRSGASCATCTPRRRRSDRRPVLTGHRGSPGTSRATVP